MIFNPDLIITKENAMKEAYKEVDAILLMIVTIPLQDDMAENYLKSMKECYDKSGLKNNKWYNEIQRQEDKFHQGKEIKGLDIDKMKVIIHDLLLERK